MFASTPSDWRCRKASPVRWPSASVPHTISARILGLPRMLRTTFSTPMFSVSHRPEIATDGSPSATTDADRSRLDRVQTATEPPVLPMM